MRFIIEKDLSVQGRYVTFEMLTKILANYSNWKTSQEGHSVLGIPIPLYRIGEGRIKILIWSQMHGNESTTTKALLDIFKFFNEKSTDFLQKCSLFVIPMLNPDGAKKYTRINANEVDLNRDAQQLTQPESQFLRTIFDEIKPDFCFNLHDQRTIFGVGNTENPATISFLTPAADIHRKINLVRQKSMEIISVINDYFQKIIPNQIARFDDTFNNNCTGDAFTTLNVPTILFEAGHFQNDYLREQTRMYIAEAILVAIKYICENEVLGKNYQNYFQIPENNTSFCDILVINDINNYGNLAIFFQEILENDEINCIPRIEENIYNKVLFGHKKMLLSSIIKEKNNNWNEVKNEVLSVLTQQNKNIFKI